MKYLPNIFAYYFIFLSLGSFKSQVLENSKLNLILKQSKTDSIKKIERLAALKFHKLINAYRLKNGADTLVWDDTLWLTSRNHDIWMDSGSELSHDEKPGSKNFTGKSPGDRYEFASNKKGSCSWSGENALYNWNKNGNSIDEISNEIAVSSFTQWKNSPGHNQNMLAKASKAHGVAFYLGSGRVWGTDLFAYQPNYLKHGFNKKLCVAEVVELASIETKSVEIKAPRKKYIKLDLEATKNNLLNTLYNSSCSAEGKAEKNKIMEKAAVCHTEYMANAKLLTHEEKKGKRNFSGENERKRMMKASGGLYFFTRHKNRIRESIALLETDISEMNIDSIADKIKIQLNKNSNATGDILKVGYGVNIKRIKNQLRIYVTRVEKFKKPGGQSLQI